MTSNRSVLVSVYLYHKSDLIKCNVALNSEVVESTQTKKMQLFLVLSCIENATKAERRTQELSLTFPKTSFVS